jgi:CheY-like chemotaxis protein
MAFTTRNLVLVVEDDRELRELYRRTLAIAGYSVAAVEDGIDALRRIDVSARKPDVLVLDMALPRLGGRDVQRELASRADTRDIQVVVVTGGDARDLDPDDFACILRKPFDPEALVEAVENCLRKRQ